MSTFALTDDEVAENVPLHKAASTKQQKKETNQHFCFVHEPEILNIHKTIAN